MLLEGAVKAASLRQEFRQANPLRRPSQITCKIQLKTTKILALQGRQTRTKAFEAFF